MGNRWVFLSAFRKVVVNAKNQDGESCPAETFVKMRDDFNQKDRCVWFLDRCSWLQLYNLDEQKGWKGDPIPVTLKVYWEVYIMFQRCFNFSKGKGGYPWESTPTMYTTMYLIYMAYMGQYEGISRKQLVGYSPKGTHIFPLNFGGFVDH